MELARTTKKKSSGFLLFLTVCATVISSCSILPDHVEYKSYVSKTLGIATEVPSTWTPFWPEGIFVRDMPTVDPSFLVFGVLPGTSIKQFEEKVIPQLGVEDNKPASTGSMTTESFDWDLYSFPIQKGFLLSYYPDYGTLQFDAALAQLNDTLYAVALGSPENERDKLFEDVFLPAVEAFSLHSEDIETRFPLSITPPERDYWPTKGWQEAVAKDHGLNEEKLQEMVDYINENEIPIKDVLIVKDGYIVFEESFRRYQSIDNLQSVTKSFTSALIGIAIDQGYLEGVDQSVVQIYSQREIKNLDSRKESLTIEDLLTMRAGLEWPAGPCPWLDGMDCADYTTQIMLEDDNSLQFTLDQPMEKEPGTEFQYNSGASHLLAGIIHETTGMTPLDFANENLFAPLGIERMSWASDGEGLNIGWSEIKMLPRDMAKFGYLFLNQGKWDGDQIISAEWVLESQKPHAIAASQGIQSYYGYQWWVNPELGFYDAAGAGGNYIIVVPDLDMVVVFTGDLYGVLGQNVWWEGTPEELFRVYILPAVE